MKTIGLIGGMSWESSLEYYRIINQKVKKELGWLHSSKCILYSLNFNEIEILQHEGRWDELTKIMIETAKTLEKAWADFILICTNTMHKMAKDVQNNINIPLLHIADATAKIIQKKDIKKVWLLWTKFTMEQDFYKQRLEKKFDLDVLVPNNSDREIIHNIIYNELCLWKIKDDSKKEYIKIIEKLVLDWAEAIILGCTEIPLLIKQEDVKVPLLDTTTIHAENAVLEAIL